MLDQVPTLIEFVRDVAAGAWAPLLISFLLEHVAWFQKLNTEAKKWTVPVIFVVLPVVGQIALQYVPAEVWTALEPFWNSLAMGFVGYVGSQLAHSFQKR